MALMRRTTSSHASSFDRSSKVHQIIEQGKPLYVEQPTADNSVRVDAPRRAVLRLPHPSAWWTTETSHYDSFKAIKSQSRLNSSFLGYSNERYRRGPQPLHPGKTCPSELLGPCATKRQRKEFA